MSQAIVLVGNKWTADALREIGHSTRGAKKRAIGQRQLLLRCKGWSNVGTGIASALQTDAWLCVNDCKRQAIRSGHEPLDKLAGSICASSLLGSGIERFVIRRLEFAV